MVVLEVIFLVLFVVFILLLIFYVVLPIRRIEPLAITTLNNLNATVTNLNQTVNTYKPSVTQTFNDINQLTTEAKPILDSVETALCGFINPRPAYCPQTPPPAPAPVPAPRY